MTELRRHWTLDPAVTFLNHGSFGACPQPVLDHQSELRAEMERQPVTFLVRVLEERLDAARRALADFVGTDPAGLAFVPNATTGVGAIVAGISLRPGDEIVVTDHGYNTVRNIVDLAASRAGAAVRQVTLPFAGIADDLVTGAVLAAVGPRTRLVIVDHATSPTALILPVAAIAAALEPGIPVLIDGAHGPGMLPLDLDGIGASFYVGNCHKWLCAPKGSGFLHAADRVRSEVLPAVVSHGFNSARRDRSRFHQLFDWTGTADPTPYLTIPTAIEFVGSLQPGGWPAIQVRNRRLAQDARTLLTAALGTPALPPSEMIGSMASLPLPALQPAPASPDTDPLAVSLRADHGIEVPVFSWGEQRMLRISAHLYNEIGDYESLAVALASEIL